MDEATISVSNVSKTFKLPHEKQTSIKGAVVNVFKGKTTYEQQKVLKNITFDIKKGEFFGIVGRNGSGKSTLLKLLAGIYAPDSGSIHVNGVLTPFIELGVGFNPELTGRENVYLNGALLGFGRKQMDGLYENIVTFAELEKFMDQKLKNYSSGMQVRLAFSIAIQAKSDILLIDEVLAVGDAAFQSKCFEYFRKIKKDGRTVVFVTHDMNSVNDFCDRALMIDKGKIKAIGKPADIASLYTLVTAGTAPAKEEDTSVNHAAGIELIGVEMEDNDSVIRPTDEVNFTIKYRLTKKFKHQLGISIMKNGISLHERNTKDAKLSSNPGVHTIEWRAPASCLNKGLHYINIAAFTDKEFKLVAYINEANKFFVEKNKPFTGGLVDMKSDWGKVK